MCDVCGHYSIVCAAMNLGGYTTKYLANGMNCVLHGLTGQIDASHYPSEVSEGDVLSSTVHTVTATISDLREFMSLSRIQWNVLFFHR